MNRQENAERGLGSSVLAPWPVGIGIATIVAALLFSPWVLMIGVPVWALAVVSTAFSRLKRRAQASIAHDRELAALPEDLQKTARQIDSAVERIEESIDAADESSQYLMANVQVEVNDLMEEAHSLLNSAGRMRQYLDRHPEQELHDRREQLERNLQNTEDEVARADLQDARERVDEQIQTRERMETLLDRTRAALSNIEATLGTVHAEVIQMSSDSVSATMTERPAMRELDELRGSVSALQDVISSEISQV